MVSSFSPFPLISSLEKSCVLENSEKVKEKSEKNKKKKPLKSDFSFWCR